jgi:hypothetical protein
MLHHTIDSDQVVGSDILTTMNLVSEIHTHPTPPHAFLVVASQLPILTNGTVSTNPNHTERRDKMLR